MILEGKTLAKQIRESLPSRAEACKNALGRPLKLVGIGWAADYASYLYLKKELEAAEKTGVATEIIDIQETTTEAEFEAIIKKVSQDDTVDAVLVPKPLPKHLNTARIWENFPADKDIDGSSTLNMGRLFMCKSWDEVSAMQGFAPCTAMAVMRLLEFHKIDLKGKEVAVLGRSATVGKPLAHMVSCKDATVKICHSRTADITASLSQEAIVISAIGKARFLKDTMIPEGIVVVDVGTNQDENGVFCGDVDYEPVSKKAASVSPVPGGVGPITLACLLENIIISGERKIKK
ncbi:methylenetetrahydrofolate dehydrogenase (NADP+)/methenyltetrahydrofolate cyclohydrolase [Elusimicrobium posterum]|uniref:bifunctional 5,10-methylenetetrahydrofolate dehydrogenase/5,10-methenyltetrahydrofolate cyclohydrolase n=1 Tax=Elusimicrobium posterum TaxID=3116653 RepID=UPI003C77B61F